MISVLDILSDDQLCYKNIRNSVLASKESEVKYKVEYGDIVFVRSSEVSQEVGWARAYMDNTFSLFSGFTIRGKKINLYDPLFIELIINSKGRKQIESLAGGSTRFNVSQKILKEVKIYIPTVTEQVKISSLMKKIDCMLELHQRKINKLNVLKQIYVSKLYVEKNNTVPNLRFKNYVSNWRYNKLGELVSISTGKLDANAMVKNGDYDFYTSGVKKYRINIPAFEGPAITIAGNGATVGYMHLADGEFNAYQRTYVITNFEIDRLFLYFEIGRKLPKKIYQEVRSGNIPYIVKEMLINLEINSPIERLEQESIGRLIIKIEDIIDLNQGILHDLYKLKTSYLQKMFL